MLVAAVLGALAGLVAGEGSRALAAGRIVRGAPDRLSWLLAVTGAVVATTHPAAWRGPLVGALGLVLLGLLLLVLASDIRQRLVYPAVVYPAVAIAVATAPFLGKSVLDALLGAAASAALFAALYLLILKRSGPGALGRGDVTAAALLGAAAGLSRLPFALILVGVIGGLIAVVGALRDRSLGGSMPYAPALCLAALAATFFPAR